MNFLIWSLPLLSGMCDASRRIVIKSTKIHNFTLVSCGFMLALPYYFIWLLLEGMPEVKSAFWIAIVFHVPLLLIANVLMVEAHRASPLILTAPYLAFTPAFLLITSPIMKAGTPTWLGVLGVLILTIGLYTINTQEGQIGLLAPFKQLVKEKGSWLMLLVAAIFSITANLDLIAFRNANAPFYLLVDHGLCSVLMAVILIIYYFKSLPNERSVYSPIYAKKVLFFYGLIVAMEVILHLLAFRWIPIVPYVISGKRAGSILLTVGLGFILGIILKHKDYQDERQNLKYRIPGTLLMIIGMIIIICWGKV